MGCVEADAHVRAGEHTPHVLVAFHERPPVRVEHVLDAELSGYLVHLRERAQQMFPLPVGELDARRPAVVDDGGRADEVGSERGEEGRLLPNRSERGVEARRVVKDER